MLDYRLHLCDIGHQQDMCFWELWIMMEKFEGYLKFNMLKDADIRLN